MRISDWSSDVCSSDLSSSQRKGACPMLFERPVAVNEAVPLFVDVDGTLTRADISLESFVRIARSSVAAMMAVLLWLVAGRAVAKTLAARRDRIDPEIGRASCRERVCQYV